MSRPSSWIQNVILVLLLRRGCWSLVPTVFASTRRVSIPSSLFWSCQAEVQECCDIDDDCSINLTASVQLQCGNETFDLQSPRRWLEYCEIQDGQEEGAYTVLRCDFSFPSKSWKVWGRLFHMNRLASSHKSLLKKTQQVQPDETSRAAKGTHKLIQFLLEAAAESIMESESLETASRNDVVTLMLTVLWVPKDCGGIKVRGHVFHSGQIVVPKAYNPEPITASIAHIPGIEEATDFEPLPNRHNNFPEAKLSSWCRRRTLLEKAFKPVGVGEVLLTRDLGGDVEILEGLTSNLFVVYDDGTLRTPAVGSVLGGYARKLVLDHAEECNLRIEFGPLLMSEILQWKEVFITSSIRLITPVDKIVIIQNSGGEATNKRTIFALPKVATRASWRHIYMRILEDHADKAS